MTIRSMDTKLARRLQKRGKWNKYGECLREVQKHLVTHERVEVKAMIDAGKLDPPNNPEPS